MNHMKKERTHTMDLISCLPDPIVHHIMSFLSTSDVTKLSILSKRFFFLWGSYPVIDLDQERFARTYQGTWSSITNSFIDHVHNTVLLHQTDIVLSEFRVNASLEGIVADARFDSTILNVLVKGVKCMELNLGFAWYQLPTNFASRTLTVLRLRGFQLNLCKLIQVCPSLTTVSLTSCIILRNIKFSSKTLREIEIHSCVVRSIKINAPNLRVFTFINVAEIDPQPCEIDVLECQNILYFSLNNVVVNGDVWIEQHVKALSRLKTFILNGCQDIQHIRIWNDKLERVELTDCPLLTSIELKTISLESFLYKGVFQHIICNITFLTLECIKDLSIMGSSLVTDQWLEDHLAKMTRLTKLRLKDCKSLKNIKVFHENLEMLELNSCDGLVEAEIDTPQLVSFVYYGKVIEVGKMVTHSNCIATLSMNPWITYDNASFCKWREMLSFFGHCKALKLICNTQKEVMIPELHTERLVSPLYDLQHVEIQIKSLKKITRDLVDSLLWLSPLPKTLHISSGCCSRLQMIIKFMYIDMIEGGEDKNPFCCGTKPIKCWKHHSRRLEIQTSGVSSNESIELQKYFLENAKISDIYCVNLRLK